MSYHDGIALGVYCTTGAVRVLYPLDKECFIRFKLVDATGKEVPKTKLGRQWGSRFGKFPKKPGPMDRMAGLSTDGPHTKGNPMDSMGIIIGSPKDLFVDPGRGLYMMEMEVHLMKRLIYTNRTDYIPITIPTFSVPVRRGP